MRSNKNESLADAIKDFGSVVVGFCDACRAMVAEDHDYPFFVFENFRARLQTAQRSRFRPISPHD